jgi:hypothetical protein
MESVKALRIPLYYCGKSDTASVSERDGKSKIYKLDRDYSIELPVKVPARGVTWFLVE